jgi:hypothetical protein
VAPRDLDRERDLGGRGREAHRGGAPLRHPGVARVQRELEGFGAGAVGAERRAQVGDERVGCSDATSLPMR